MEITKRETIVSIAIVALMLTIGFLISGKIEDYQNDKNAEYTKAIHIDEEEMFRYGMDTSIGDAFVYGDLIAVDPVTFKEVKGDYLYIKKVEEHYNRHTRKVTKTKRDANGKSKTYTETEVYYSWDYFDSWEKHSKKVKFCGVEFNYEKFDIPGKEYIKTEKRGISDVRYKYYGVPAKHTGTLYARLSNGTISENPQFFEGYTIEQALESCTSGIEKILFWFAWIALTAVCVLGFCELDNWWLE